MSRPAHYNLITFYLDTIVKKTAPAKTETALKYLRNNNHELFFHCLINFVE